MTEKLKYQRRYLLHKSKTATSDLLEVRYFHGDVSYFTWYRSALLVKPAIAHANGVRFRSHVFNNSAMWIEITEQQAKLNIKVFYILYGNLR